MIRLNCRVILCAAGALIVATGAAESQAPQTAAWRDSAATRVVAGVLLERLAVEFARALDDTTTTPWRLALPDSTTGVRWAAVRATIVSHLRARPPRDTDTHERILHVESLRITDDSLSFTFFLGGRWQCAESSVWRGSGTSYRAALAWAEFTWLPRAEPLDFSDSAPCARTR